MEASSNVPMIQINFGRLVENVGETVLPLRLSPNMRNVDVSSPNKSISRRKGYQRALESIFNGPVYFHSKFKDTDGRDVYIVIDDDGVNRVES